MKKLDFYYGIFDEAHMLKNMLSVRYKYLSNFKVRISSMFSEFIDFIPDQTETAVDRHTAAKQFDRIDITPVFCDACNVHDRK